MLELQQTTAICQQTHFVQAVNKRGQHCRRQFRIKFHQLWLTHTIVADTDDTQYLHKAESYFTQLAVFAADLTYTGIPRKTLCITVYNFIHQGKKK